MELNLPIIAKKLWKLVRVVYFMLRKGISKGKLLADLSIMMKRGNLAGKSAIYNLMFHHNHLSTAMSSRRSHDNNHLSYPMPLNEYELCCSNTPSFHLPFHFNKRKHASSPNYDVLMMAALEMINSSAVASPALPGFGPSPMVRQLRITDSPFPLKDGEVENHVDEAAEDFIMRFYRDLKRQNGVGYS